MRPVVLFLLVAATAAAEDAAVRLTVEEAAARAREASPLLGRAAAAREAAEAGLRAARAGRLPSAELSASYTRQSHVPELILALPGAPPRTIFPDLPDAWRSRAQVAAPLLTGGRVAAAIDAGVAQVDAARADAGTVRADVVLDTIEAYWSLVTARETEHVLAESLRAYDAHLRDARNRLDVGLAARNEVLAVQVERERGELARIRAANAASIAEADLARLTGLPPGTRIETIDGGGRAWRLARPADATGPVPPADAPGPMPPAVPVAPLGEDPRLRPGTVPAAPSDTAELIAHALDRRHELRALRARVDAAEAAVRIERAGGRPQASALAAYDLANPNTRVLPLRDEWKGTWSVGVGVSWAVWTGGRTDAAVAQARARADALRQELRDAEERIRLQVESRALELDAARAALAVAARAEEAARENVQVASDRYREGVASSADLLDAETVLLRAGLEHTQAAAAVRLAEAALSRAAGAEPGPAGALP